MLPTYTDDILAWLQARADDTAAPDEIGAAALAHLMNDRLTAAQVRSRCNDLARLGYVQPVMRGPIPVFRITALGAALLEQRTTAGLNRATRRTG